MMIFLESSRARKFRQLILLIVACLMPLPGNIQASDLILNEYNAVLSVGGFLGGGNSDSRLGIREGNGGDWFELVVVGDHLDIRGWQITISHRTGQPALPGPGEEIFVLTFSQESIWSDLRSGTIITVSEDYPNNAADYLPIVGQWWINVRASNGSVGRYISASDFAVSRDNTQISIKNAQGDHVFGPAGEGISPVSGVGGTEIFKLEDTPFAGSVPDSAWYKAGTSSTYGMPNRWTDPQGPMSQDFSLLRSVVPYFPLSSVVINEVNVHSDPPEQDWIELYNTTPFSINIGGWFLSDGPINLMQYQIPPSTIISAGGYAVFTESVLPFSLNGQTGESVFLSEGNGSGGMTGGRDYVSFGPMENGVSFGRNPNGSGPFYRMTSRTAAGPNSPADVGPIVIGEVMYHAAGPPPTGMTAGDLDFIELENLSALEIPLEVDYGSDGFFGWEIGGGIQYTFTNGASIPGLSYLILVSFDPVADASKLANFRLLYDVPPSIAVLGPYGGKLNNYSDSIKLLRPDTPSLGVAPMVLRDSVSYFDWDAWPTSPDGGGPSLERLDSSLPERNSRFWAASVTINGTPGRINSVPEPATIPAILSGLLLLRALARRNSSRAHAFR